MLSFYTERFIYRLMCDDKIVVKQIHLYCLLFEFKNLKNDKIILKRDFAAKSALTDPVTK